MKRTAMAAVCLALALLWAGCGAPAEEGSGAAAEEKSGAAEVPAAGEEEAAVLTITSGGETVTPFLHHAYSEVWDGHGFLSADGVAMETALTAWDEAEHLPALTYAADFAVAYGEKVTLRRVIPFDEAMSRMDNLYDMAELANLAPGRYFIGILVDKEGSYIAGADETEHTGLVCLFRLTIS